MLGLHREPLPRPPTLVSGEGRSIHGDSELELDEVDGFTLGIEKTTTNKNLP